MELTRAELDDALKSATRGQELRFRDMLDERLAPINEHVARIDRGEFNPAQASAIVSAVQASRDAKTNRRAAVAPIIALIIAAASLLASILVSLAVGGVIGGG